MPETIIFHIPAYLISFAIGLLLIRLLKIQKILSQPLAFALAIGFGLSVSAILFFLSLFLFKQFHPWLVLGLNLIMLAALAMIHMIKPPHQINPSFTTKQSPASCFNFYLMLGILGILFFAAIALLSQQYRYGGWDAWGLYNMKAKFLVFGETRWFELATMLHDHTQPGYPILLPLMNSWIFSIFQKNLIAASSMTSIVLCAATGFLLYAGLARFMKKELALIGFLALVSHPWWIFWGTTQYADILLGYFLLASIILALLTIKEKNENLAFCSGLFLGLMTFAKNEGIVISFFLLGLTSIFLFFDRTVSRKKASSLIIRLIFGAVLGSLCTIAFKLMFAPSNRDIKINPFISELKYFNLTGFTIITDFYFSKLTSLFWNFIWILLGLTAVLQLPRFFKKECKVVAVFFILYGLTLLYIYLTTAGIDLVWRLSCTADRILANLLPSAIFFTFYVLWRESS